MLKMFLIYQKNFILRCLFILKFSNSQVNDKFIYHKKDFNNTIEITSYVTCYVTSNIINSVPLSLVGNGFIFSFYFSSFYYIIFLNGCQNPPSIMLSYLDGRKLNTEITYLEICRMKTFVSLHEKLWRYFEECFGFFLRCLFNFYV